MHPLFEEVFSTLDASRATDLLSVDDKEIETDLPEIIRGIQSVIDTERYEDNDNEQMVMELCMSKVVIVTAGNQKCVTERLAQGCADLLEVCQKHNLKSLVKGKTTPHAKIVETVLNLMMMNYLDANFAKKFVPECVKLLDCDNKDLRSQATSCITATASVLSESLSSHGECLVTLFLRGNTELGRVLYEIYKQISQPIYDHLEELIAELDKSSPGTKISLFQLLGEVAKQKPELLERHVDTLCKHLDFTMGAPVLLLALTDLAIRFPKAFLPHRNTFESIGTRHSHMVFATGEIIVAIATISEEEGNKSMSFLIEQLKRVDSITVTPVLSGIKNIGILYPHLLYPLMNVIEKLVENKTSSHTRVFLKQMKEDFADYQLSTHDRHQTIIERSAGGIICAPSTDDILAPTENRSDLPSPYEDERRHNPGGVYPMESTPRGLALIIDNEIFEHPVMSNRHGTYEDRVHLVELFQNTFHFEVIVAENCTAQAMIQKLQEFGSDERLRTVDACAVAVLSHGTRSDVIYGTDGRITDGIPQMGTYITTTDIRDILSPTNCPALNGKPKLYIVQACRGGLEDTPQGQQYFRRDVVMEDRVSPLEELRNPNADICFLYATVENYVAYRNKFVPLLCSVFQQHVYTTHVKDMATILHRTMSQEPVNQGCLTVSEERGNLRKKWFLNPPRNET